MNPDPQDVDTIIQSAIEALKRGDTVNVTRLARQAASIAPESEVAWLLLATVAQPEDSLAFVREALKVNPQSQGALEALAWAQGRLPSASAEQSLPDIDAAQPAQAEPESPADALEQPEETSTLQGWMSTELEDTPEIPVDETDDFAEPFSPASEASTELEDAPETIPDEMDGFDEAFPPPDGQTSELEATPEIPADEPPVFDEVSTSPVVPSTEIEVESEIPMDELSIFDEAYSPSTGLPPSRDAEPERDTEEFPVPTEQPAKTGWTFAETAPLPDKMHAPIRQASLTDSRSPAARRGKRTVFSTLLIFLISALAVVTIATLFGLIFLRPQLSSLWANIFPNDGCQASLVIGPQTYQVWPLKPDSDGNYAVPDKQPGRAYYVEGTSSNYVFFLSPVSDNQSFMSGLQTGEPGSVTWSNCDTSTYRLFQPVAQILDIPDLVDQSVTGITIIVPWPGSSSGFVLKGTLDNFLLPVISTPDAALATIAPEATTEEISPPINITGFSEFQAEISLLETIPSADLGTLQVSILINNYGNLAGRLTVCDVALTPAGGTPLAAWLTEPALPLELAPGTTQALSLTFPRPATATATLRILSVEFDLEDY